MSEKNPWKTLSSRPVYKNNWIDVREDQVLTPKGQPGIYGVVQCRPAIGIVALTDDLEVILVGQYRYTMKAYSWEIIEGGGEEDEGYLDTAQRELHEEAGVLAKNWQLVIGDIQLSNCHSDEKAHIFLAEDLSYLENDPDDTELLQIKKVKLAEAVELVDRGEISDAMSIIGIIKVARIKGIL